MIVIINLGKGLNLFLKIDLIYVKQNVTYLQVYTNSFLWLILHAMFLFQECSYFSSSHASHCRNNFRETDFSKLQCPQFIHSCIIQCTVGLLPEAFVLFHSCVIQPDFYQFFQVFQGEPLCQRGRQFSLIFITTLTVFCKCYEHSF